MSKISRKAGQTINGRMSIGEKNGKPYFYGYRQIAVYQNDKGEVVPLPIYHRVNEGYDVGRYKTVQRKPIRSKNSILFRIEYYQEKDGKFHAFKKLYVFNSKKHTWTFIDYKTEPSVKLWWEKLYTDLPWTKDWFRVQGFEIVPSFLPNEDEPFFNKLKVKILKKFLNTYNIPLSIDLFKNSRNMDFNLKATRVLPDELLLHDNEDVFLISDYENKCEQLVKTKYHGVLLKNSLPYDTKLVVIVRIHVRSIDKGNYNQSNIQTFLSIETCCVNKPSLY